MKMRNESTIHDNTFQALFFSYIQLESRYFLNFYCFFSIRMNFPISFNFIVVGVLCSFVMQMLISLAAMYEFTSDISFFDAYLQMQIYIVCFRLFQAESTVESGSRTPTNSRLCGECREWKNKINIFEMCKANIAVWWF